MRDYIFHGKSKHEGKWVEGCLIHQGDYCCILHTDVHPADEPYLDDDTGCIDGYATPVVPESVGQYTGMKDKNGRKIFEGDIVQRAWDDHPTVYRVIFDELLAAFIGEVKPYGQFTTFDGDGEHFEVIGNEFENADLLEG